MADASGALVVVETSAGEVRESSLELLSAAPDLAEGGPVNAVVVGSGVASVAEQVARLGASSVLVADHAELERYTTDGYTAAIEAAIEQTAPRLVLLAGTTSGRDLGPYLAARAGTNCLSDCIALRWEGDRLAGTRPVFQGKMLTDVSFQPGDTAFAVIRSGSYSVPEETGNGQIEDLAVDISGDAIRVRLINLEQPKVGKTNLSDADVVIVGGRGVGSAENFELLQELADQLGGVVGATRAVTDLGWRPHFEQIGQTGANIRPKLYIGIGVSGAVQHLVGMHNSDTIVAINRDPEAPLFRLAEIGVVGDLHEILPAVIAEVKAVKGS